MEVSTSSSIRSLPLVILICLVVWHLAQAFYHGYSVVNHIAVAAVSLFIGITGLFAYVPGEKEWQGYLQELLDRNRNLLIGLSCMLVGALHFLTFSKTGDVVPMFVYMVLILAYYDLGSLAVRIEPYTRHASISISTSRFTRYSLGKIGIVLGLTLILSILMMFVSLMGIVGFTSVWTVLILVALMMGSLGMIVRGSNA